MTQQADTRSIKAEGLKVFQIDEGQYYVESSEGKVCYKVSLNGTKTCACGDFAIHAPKDPSFVCKHIIAVTNGNGNVIPLFEPHKIRIEERFIKLIKGKEFVLYPGILDLGHQEGIKKLEVEVIQLPTKENGQNAICKVILETLDGKVYVDYGDANPLNVNKEVAGHILRVASTRGKARVLRDATNVGMTCLEELGDIDDVVGDVREARSQKTVRKEEKAPEPKKEVPKETKAPGLDPKTEVTGTKKITETSEKVTDISSKEKTPEPKSEGDKPTISIAQKNAIDNLAKRRGFSPESVKEMATKQFGKDLDTITTAEASQFIRHLQQAA